MARKKIKPVKSLKAKAWKIFSRTLQLEEIGRSFHKQRRH